MRVSKKKGIFITFEGPEGSGKSTQAKLIYDFLIKRGYKVIHTREPGGTGVAEAIRQILLNPKYSVSPMTELLLYEASRHQHTQDVITPAIKSGKVVICERYTDATLAYQGYGRGIDLKTIEFLNKMATENLKPDLTLYLDIPSGRGLVKARKKLYYSNGDRIENESMKFHGKVRRGYLKIAKKNPERIKVVKVQSDIDFTNKKILKIIMRKVKK